MSWRPIWTVPPWELLEEHIRESDKTFEQTAADAGIPRGELVLICTGRKPIDDETAGALERGTGVPASLWRNMQRTYDRGRNESIAAQMRALLDANAAVAKEHPDLRPGGALRLAATHSGAYLLEELRKIGWELARTDEHHALESWEDPDGE